MESKTQKRSGRPRGSAKPPAVLSVELPPAESVPFLAGMRVYDDYPLFDEKQFATLTLVSPFLTQAERRAITPMGDDRFRLWLIAGYLYGAMRAAVKEAQEV